MRALVLVAFATMTACNALPRDPQDTSQRIEKRGFITVGAFDASARAAPQTQHLLAELEKRTGGRVQWQPGSGDAVLRGLEAGALDLAIGQFDANSPWRSYIAFGPPLSATGSGSHRLELKAAMQNGENQWIMTVERASRAVSPEARAQ